MLVSVQLQFYPLDGNLGRGIDLFVKELQKASLNLQEGNMATVVWGELEVIWPVIQKAMDKAFGQHPATLHITVSNACPLPVPQEETKTS